eukprot:8821_1
MLGHNVKYSNIDDQNNESEHQQTHYCYRYNSNSNINKMLKQHLNRERNSTELQQQNRELKEAKTDLEAQNSFLTQQNIRHEKKYYQFLEQNIALEENCAVLTKTIDELNAQQNSSLKRKNDELTKQNNVLTQQNSDLNEECKELKLELEDIKHKYNTLVRQNNDYTEWDSDDIVNWIMNLDKAFNRYESVLRKTLKDEELTGGDLMYLDKNDLNRFGIKAFKHKQWIMEEIQKLTTQQQNNNVQNDNIIPYNE